MTKIVYFLTVILGLAALPAHSAMTSAYTSTSAGACRNGHDEHDAIWLCRGVGGFTPVFIDHGPWVRLSFDIVRPARQRDLGEPAKWHTEGVTWTAAGNGHGPRIEWRLRDGKPVAVILRIDIGPSGNGECSADTARTLARSGVACAVVPVAQRLIVLRLPDGCLVEAIDARRRDANVVARAVADSAEARNCQRGGWIRP